MNELYSHNRYTGVTTTTSFSPTNSNWFINASGNGQNIYFQNLSSYNNWAGTCCGQSAANIQSGSFGGYNINYNRF